MLHGETITILRRVNGDPDSFGASSSTITQEHVDNVLITDGTGSNSTDSTRPDGITVAKTLYFPRSWEYKSLRGCQIRIDGQDHTVIGDPRPYKGGITPTQWNLSVPVKDTRG